MAQPYQESTAIAGRLVGPAPYVVCTQAVFRRKFLAAVIAGMAVLLFSVAGWFALFTDASVTAQSLFFLALIALMGAGGVYFWARTRVPVVIETNTVVYFERQWHLPGKGLLHFPAYESPDWRPKVYRTDPCSATWRTDWLSARDGGSVRYDVELTFQMDQGEQRHSYLGTSYIVEEDLMRGRVEPTLKHEVRRTGETRKPGIFAPGAKRTDYLVQLEELAMNAAREHAKERGLLLLQVRLHNSQVQEAGAAALVPVEIIPPGEHPMSDTQLVRTLRTDYDIVVPELFDPVAIKRDLDTLRQRGQPGMIRRFINYLARRVPPNEQGLLKAWEAYYTQVGATLEAGHAARRALEQAEVTHRLFLEASIAKVEAHRADAAEAQARVAEAEVRKAVAAKNIQTINNPPKAKSEPPLSRADQAAVRKKAFEKSVAEVKAQGHPEDIERGILRDLEENHRKDLNKLYGR